MLFSIPDCQGIYYMCNMKWVPMCVQNEMGPRVQQEMSPHVQQEMDPYVYAAGNRSSYLHVQHKMGPTSFVSCLRSWMFNLMTQ